MDADSVFGGYNGGHNGVMVLPRAPSPPPSRHEVRARKLMTRNPAAYQGGGPAVVPPPMRRARVPPGGGGTAVTVAITVAGRLALPTVWATIACRTG